LVSEPRPRNPRLADAIKRAGLVERTGRGVETHGRITRREAVALTGLGEEQARYHLRKLTEHGVLELVGARRGAHYRIPGSERNGE